MPLLLLLHVCPAMCCSAGVVTCIGPVDPPELQAWGDAVHPAQRGRGGRGACACGNRVDAGECAGACIWERLLQQEQQDT
jgi:hypothetical protein